MAIKTIRVLGELGEAERRELVLALRLMTASGSMRSALRNLGRLPRGDFTPPSEADRYYLLFAAIGAAGEAIKVIKKGARTGRFDRDLISTDPKLTAAWDRATAEPPPRDIKVALRARDKYWAHWDADVAAAFVAGLTGCESDPAMSESSGEGEHATTSFRWVRQSWFADLERELNLTTGDEAVNLVQGMMDVVRDTNDLAGTLASRIVRRTGLRTILDERGDDEAAER